jgi:hypothetical protein
MTTQIDRQHYPIKKQANDTIAYASFLAISCWLNLASLCAYTVTLSIHLIELSPTPLKWN